jgi:hypothetical protein
MAALKTHVCTSCRAVRSEANSRCSARACVCSFVGSGARNVSIYFFFFLKRADRARTSTSNQQHRAPSNRRNTNYGMQRTWSCSNATSAGCGRCWKTVWSRLPSDSENMSSHAREKYVSNAGCVSGAWSVGCSVLLVVVGLVESNTRKQPYLEKGEHEPVAPVGLGLQLRAVGLEKLEHAVVPVVLHRIHDVVALQAPLRSAF